MRVAVVGGSGNFGSALTWALAEQGHHVIIGSRTAERAVDAAGFLGAEIGNGAVEGARNADAVAGAEVVLLCVPTAGHAAILQEIAPAAAGRVVVDTCVCHHPLRRGEWAAPPEGSAAARARRLLPRSAAVAATLHSVPVHSLRLPERHPAGDVLIAADGQGALEAARALLQTLHLRPVEAGDLSAAAGLEHLAVLLGRLSEHHRVAVPGMRFHNLGDSAPRESDLARAPGAG